ncbi:glycosyltransferase family 2 protein [Yoonia sp. R2331]|uniref:glycosyltransferase family 2 protein n=1 Tax=Yoonia sp. R2331 TaxID=3237238 RepID=UPI0034E396A6
MTHPAVSVVVVSLGRPAELNRCLVGLFQLDYAPFEVVVVADAESCKGLGTFQRRIKLVHFETVNISAARNAGIAQACGEIVAFIDDDAVPEPSWLLHLIAPFSDPYTAISGGFVIGRNGISLQWAARQVQRDGTAEAIEPWGDTPRRFDPKSRIIAKTEGTNMAVRRTVLEAVGGFDEAFAFYLDETDLNVRIADAGHVTAVVPMARVHHGFAASARRTAHRVPRDLTEIAASTAVFQRKHLGRTDKAPARRAQRLRLVRHMVAGDLMPGDVLRMMRGFDRGWSAGETRDANQRAQPSTPPEFKPVTVQVRGHRTMTARFWRANRATAHAIKAVEGGSRVTLFLFSATARKHKVWFDPRGFWVQRGGQFGPSERDQPWFRRWRAKTRTQQEMARLSQVRPFDAG